MCLALPGKVTAITDDDPFLRTGRVAFASVVTKVNLSFVPEANVGDYVLVHAGFAIAKLNEAEAARSLAYIDELDAASQAGP
jgi:hydrogenase expression/formation protein HypC